MRKKMALLLGSILLAGLYLFFPYCPHAADVCRMPQTLAEGSLGGEVRQAEALLRRLSPTLDASLVRLCFRGEELACDQASKTWYLPVAMDSAAWEAGAFTDVQAQIGILPLQDYTLLNKQDVTAAGQPVPFLAWQESEGACTVIKVVFTGLPVVRVETGADLDVDTVFAGSAVFYEDCARQDWTMYSAFQAHERGQTTRAFPKKGYRFELISVTSTGAVNKNPQPVLGMRDSDSWIFYAVYSDGTKARDKFCIELWNAFGAVNTPYDAHFGTHMEYAELIVNGEYRGLYGIMEPIDSSQLGISDQEYLYKRTYARELTPALFDEAEPEEYISLLGVEIKGRDGAGAKEDWQQLRRFAQMCAADDEKFSKEAQKMLHMENITDIWLYLQMIYGEDNIYKNMFFAFKKETDGYRLYLAPWDVDLSWGNVYIDDAQSLYTVFDMSRAGEYLAWPLADRLFKLDVGGIRARAADRWKELRQGVLSDEAMGRVLAGCVRRVQDSGAFERDAARWPDSSHGGDYGSLETFMDTRLAYMDRLMEDVEKGLIWK